MNLHEIKLHINKIRPDIFVIFFITIIYLHSIDTKSFEVDSTSFIIHLLIVPLTAAVVDIVINYVKHRTIIKPYRALVTGLIISIIIIPGNILFSIIVPAISITLKHIIKFNKRTVFNPAALGILISTMFFSVSSVWWMSSFLIVPFGIFMAWRVKNLTTSLSFLIVYYFIGFTQGIPITINYFLLFFAFIMVLEPITSAHTQKGKIVFGTLVGILSIFVGLPYVDIFLFSLLIVNPMVYILDKKLK